MKLLEFVGIIIETGDGRVRIKPPDAYPSILIPATLGEQQACGARLYSNVRLKLETVEDEAAPTPTTEAKP